jgi:hypothetical protein
MTPDRFSFVQQRTIEARAMRSAYIRTLLLRAARRAALWLSGRAVPSGTDAQAATAARPARLLAFPLNAGVRRSPQRERRTA